MEEALTATPQEGEQERRRRTRPLFWLLWLVLIFCTLFWCGQLATRGSSGARPEGGASGLSADYRPWPGLLFGQVGPGFIEDLQKALGVAGTPGGSGGCLLGAVCQPVPSDTPTPTRTPVPTRTPTVTQTPTRTRTPVPPTETERPPKPTATVTPTPTVTVPVNNQPIAVNDDYSTNEGETLTVSAPGVLGNDSDPDGDPMIAALEASSGNGTLTLNPDGSFTLEGATAGTATFTYRACDLSGCSVPALVQIDVNLPPPTATPPPPIADFSWTPTGNPFEIAFTDTSSGSPDSWSWDFGNAQVSSSQSPTHTYSSAGPYDVTLVVSNSWGVDSVTIQIVVP